MLMEDDMDNDMFFCLHPDLREVAGQGGGDATQRLAHYFADGLAGAASLGHRLLAAAERAAMDLLDAYQVFMAFGHPLKFLAIAAARWETVTAEVVSFDPTSSRGGRLLCTRRAFVFFPVCDSGVGSDFAAVNYWYGRHSSPARYQIVEAYQLFMAACCFKWVAFVFANMTILRSAEGRRVPPSALARCLTRGE
ncbi:hypothetical protein E2562_034227 [Oryza meyeriana var. granulata]|uniref:Uncharacterized protein n=1 Tax=Oryza meyeriana var. granulata TaxID=110450 RepID=A0A6G1CB05_9ORYZ|nr:hypothetical protein E2562_034227 [Oryza meyeriana var. granulata]